MIPEKMDAVNLIIGGEGSGKSFFALGLGALTEPGFSVSNQFHFKLGDYLKSQLEVVDGVHPTGHSLFLDEGGTQLFARSSMDRLVKSVIRMFILNRALQVQHWICVPRLESIDKYLRDNRAHMVIHVYKKKNKKGKMRRYAAVFSRAKIARMMQHKDYPLWFHDEDRMLIPRGRPNLIVHIPDLTRVIPNAIQREYDQKKKTYMRAAIQEVYDMTQDDLDRAQEAARQRAERHAAAHGTAAYGMRSVRDRPRDDQDVVDDADDQDTDHDQEQGPIPKRQKPLPLFQRNGSSGRTPTYGVDFVRVADMAPLVGVADTYLRRLCREEKIPGARKFGRCWFIPVEHIPDTLLRFDVPYKHLRQALEQLQVPEKIIDMLMDKEV